MLKERRLSRKHLIFYLRVFDRKTDEVIGHLVDITTKGVMLISEKPLKANTIFQLRMTLPVETMGSKQLSFDAKSAWVKKDINPDFYITGFEIQSIKPNDINVIEQLIKEFGFQD